MLASATAHAGLMRIPFGKALEVWFVQRLLLLALVLLVAGVGVAVLIARQAG